MALANQAAAPERLDTNSEQAQQGVSLIKSAILNLLYRTSGGLTNAEISHALGLRSDQNGNHKNMLAWSILGVLMKEGKVRKNGSYYLHAKDPKDGPDPKPMANKVPTFF